MYVIEHFKPTRIRLNTDNLYFRLNMIDYTGEGYTYVSSLLYAVISRDLAFNDYTWFSPHNTRSPKPLLPRPIQTALENMGKRTTSGTPLKFKDFVKQMRGRFSSGISGTKAKKERVKTYTYNDTYSTRF